MTDQRAKAEKLCDCFSPQHWLYPQGGACPKCGGHIPPTDDRAKAEAEADVWIQARTRFGYSKEEVADLILRVQEVARRGRCDCLFEGEKGHEKRIHCCQLHAEIELRLVGKHDAEVKRVVEEAQKRFDKMWRNTSGETHDLNKGASIACDEILHSLGLEK